MKHIKKFESFRINEGNEMGFMPVDPIKGAYDLYSEMVEWVSENIIPKLTKAIRDFIEHMNDVKHALLSFKMVSNFIEMIKSDIIKLKQFYKNNPGLCKVIMICFITSILVMVSGIEKAHAAEIVSQSSNISFSNSLEIKSSYVDDLHGAIGFLKQNQSWMTDILSDKSTGIMKILSPAPSKDYSRILLDAITHLSNLKSGMIDAKTLSADGIRIAEEALKYIRDTESSLNLKGSSTYGAGEFTKVKGEMLVLLKYMQQGACFTN